MKIWHLRTWMIGVSIVLLGVSLAGCGAAEDGDGAADTAATIDEAPMELSDVTVLDGRLQARLPCRPETTDNDEGTAVITAECRTEASQVRALYRPGDGEGTYDLGVGSTRMLKEIGDYMESLGAGNLSVDSGDVEIDGHPAVQAHVKAGVEPGNLKARLFMISDGNDAWGLWLLYQQGSQLDDMTAEIRNSISVTSAGAMEEEGDEAQGGEAV